MIAALAMAGPERARFNPKAALQGGFFVPPTRRRYTPELYGVTANADDVGVTSEASVTLLPLCVAEPLSCLAVKVFNRCESYGKVACNAAL